MGANPLLEFLVSRVFVREYYAGEETTVVHLLERDRADGLGFIDQAGDTYRQYYYDVELRA